MGWGWGFAQCGRQATSPSEISEKGHTSTRGIKREKFSAIPTISCTRTYSADDSPNRFISVSLQCLHALLFCAILCCAVLCCTVLCCAVLCCAMSLALNKQYDMRQANQSSDRTINGSTSNPSNLTYNDRNISLSLSLFLSLSLSIEQCHEC